MIENFSFCIIRIVTSFIRWKCLDLKIENANSNLACRQWLASIRSKTKCHPVVVLRRWCLREIFSIIPYSVSLVFWFHVYNDNLRMTDFTFDVIKTHENSFNREEIEIECTTSPSIEIEGQVTNTVKLASFHLTYLTNI